MNYLLDSCVFVWLLREPARVPDRVVRVLEEPTNEIFLSPASVHELGMKYRLGRLPFPEPPDVYIPRQRERHRIEELPYSESAALQISKLPEFHKDPFDRMLIAQSIAESMTLVTPDRTIHRYPIRYLW